MAKEKLASKMLWAQAGGRICISTMVFKLFLFYFYTVLGRDLTLDVTRTCNLASGRRFFFLLWGLTMFWFS
ncbi:hypothetical protein V8C40DRAFT_133132 [Trichoderma camerunense]